MAVTLDYFYRHTKDKYALTLLSEAPDPGTVLTWVQLLEDIDNCSFLRNGELIITTGLSCHTPEALCALLKRARDCGACGVIVNTGQYITEVPKKVIDYCLSVHLPLFTMPWEIHITDLMQHYCNAILEEKRISTQRNDLLNELLDSAKMEPEPSSVLTPSFPCILCASEVKLKIPGIPCYANTFLHGMWYTLFESSANGFSFLSREDLPVTGASRPFTDISAVPNAGTQALRACQTNRIRNGSGCTHFEDIGLYYAALSIRDPEVFAEARRLLSPVRDEELRTTLRLYLECQGSIKEVSEQMFLHRNTINYRIQQIRDVLDLDSPQKRMEYLFAFYLSDVANYCQSTFL